jgi:hypothetical protein
VGESVKVVVDVERIEETHQYVACYEFVEGDRLEKLITNAKEIYQYFDYAVILGACLGDNEVFVITLEELEKPRHKVSVYQVPIVSEYVQAE